MKIKEKPTDKGYINGKKQLIAVDCIVFGFTQGVLKLLVRQRDVEPMKGKWSLVGDFVKDDENVRECSIRTLYEMTGLSDIYMEELKSYSSPDRDPRERCISIAQYALVRICKEYFTILKDHEAVCFSVEDLPDLVLDHNQMVADALEHLREKARFYPIGFELLPKSFTLPQLQLLYEQIFQKKIDPRNFRKKIISLNVLKNTMKKDKSTSKKGAFLYQFDKKKYNKLSREGFNFPLFRK